MSFECIGDAKLEETGFNYTMSLIQGKYKMFILYALMGYIVVRFNEMKKYIGTISYKTLSATLKELEGGTRKPIRKWKTGYHIIARATGIPVYICYFDWGTKRVGISCKINLTDDARADTDRIQAYYETLHLTGKHPSGYITR